VAKWFKAASCKGSYVGQIVFEVSNLSAFDYREVSARYRLAS